MVHRLVLSSSQVFRLPRTPRKYPITPTAIFRVPAFYLQRANMVREALFDACSSHLC